LIKNFAKKTSTRVRFAFALADELLFVMNWQNSSIGVVDISLPNSLSGVLQVTPLMACERIQVAKSVLPKPHVQFISERN
jgi:hypothetical protein